MLDPTDDPGRSGIEALKARLASIRAQQPEIEPEMARVSVKLATLTPTVFALPREIGAEIV